MSLGQAIGTIVAGFIFPFVARIAWGKMVDALGPIGGWMAGGFILGTLWTMNHGMPTPLITQSGGAWVDMALAVAVGVYVASVARGGSVKGSGTNLLAAVIGSMVGGLVLSLVL